MLIPVYKSKEEAEEGTKIPELWDSRADEHTGRESLYFPRLCQGRVSRRIYTFLEIMAMKYMGRDMRKLVFRVSDQV